MSRLACIAALCLVTAGAHADVYKYVDKDGQVKYTDKPELLPAELLAKFKAQQAQRSSNSDLADRVAEDLKARDAAAASSADSKKAQQSVTADKAERCTKARERYDNVMNAQKLYSTDDKGERVFMDSAQIDQARAAAKQTMDTWCN